MVSGQINVSRKSSPNKSNVNLFGSDNLNCLFQILNKIKSPNYAFRSQGRSFARSSVSCHLSFSVCGSNLPGHRMASSFDISLVSCISDPSSLLIISPPIPARIFFHIPKAKFHFNILRHNPLPSTKFLTPPFPNLNLLPFLILPILPIFILLPPLQQLQVSRFSTERTFRHCCQSRGMFLFTHPPSLALPIKLPNSKLLHIKRKEIGTGTGLLLSSSHS